MSGCGSTWAKHTVMVLEVGVEATQEYCSLLELLFVLSFLSGCQLL